jgi:hypothetical protein
MLNSIITLSFTLPGDKDNCGTMATQTMDIMVLGKNNQLVPINVPAWMFSAYNTIIGLHDELGLSENPFVFAKIGTIDEHRTARDFYRKQLDFLDLGSKSKNMQSQGLRRSACSNLMVSLLYYCLLGVVIQISHPQVTKHDEVRQAAVDKRMGHSRSVASANYERYKNRHCTEVGGSAIAAEFYFGGRMANKDTDELDITSQMAQVRTSNN